MLTIVGEAELDLPSAGPEFHDWQTSCHRKVPLRTAAGSSHPDPWCQRAEHLLQPRKKPATWPTLFLVGDEGLEPPTLSV